MNWKIAAMAILFMASPNRAWAQPVAHDALAETVQAARADESAGRLCSAARHFRKLAGDSELAPEKREQFAQATIRCAQGCVALCDCADAAQRAERAHAVAIGSQLCARQEAWSAQARARVEGWCAAIAQVRPCPPPGPGPVPGPGPGPGPGPVVVAHRPTPWLPLALTAAAFAAGGTSLGLDASLSKYQLPNDDRYDLTRISWNDLQQRNRGIQGTAWAAAGLGAAAAATWALWWLSDEPAPPKAVMSIEKGAVALTFHWH